MLFLPYILICGPCSACCFWRVVAVAVQIRPEKTIPTARNTWNYLDVSKSVSKT